MFDFESYCAYQPVPYLLSRAQKTASPFIFLNTAPRILHGTPFLVLLFGPGGVGKDTISKPLIEEGLVQKVKTATNRPRRVHEGESWHAYEWMRSRHDGESEEAYVAHLVSEYGLLEHVLFNGFVYGVPVDNVRSALQNGTTLLLVTTDGVKSLCRYFHDEVSVVTVFVVPESLEQLYDRISHREHPDQRMLISVSEIQQAPTLAHYYLYNPVSYGSVPALPLVQQAFREFISSLG